MCGRYAVFLEEENQEMREIIAAINERYKEEASKMKTGDICPTYTAPVLTADSENRRIANLFKWGFPGDPAKKNIIINARCETLGQKPMFRNILRDKRCIIPVSGFYEWKTTDGKKEKYLIRSTDEKLIHLAGLYDDFLDKEGHPYTAYVIITTDANKQLEYIHNRMPVILNNDDAKAWISKKENVLEILKTYREPLVLEC